MKHLTYKEYVTAKKMINTLYENPHIKPFFEDSGHYSLNKFVRVLNDMGYTFDSGMTKGVFYNRKLLPNWVFKFDLVTHSILFNDDKLYTYCELEHHLYRQAVYDGFDEYFATSISLCTVGNIRIYLMEYVNCDECEVVSQFIESMRASGGFDEDEDDKDLYDNLRDYDCFDTIMVAYDDFDFACWASNHYINDLHSGNFGYTPDGEQLLIIDYCGYGHRRA